MTVTMQSQFEAFLAKGSFKLMPDDSKDALAGMRGKTERPQVKESARRCYREQAARTR
jgi:hypothetical protein